MSTIDYSKFEKLTKELDKEERYEKEKSRAEARDRYMKEQREKQIKWEEDMRRQGKDPEKIKANMSSCGGCASSSASSFMSDSSNHNNHNHDHDHDHNHQHQQQEHNHNDHDHHPHHDKDHTNDHSHSNNNNNNNNNNDNHNINENTEKNPSQSNETKASINKPSCGYMPIEEIKRLQKENESKPKVSIQEKNMKKEEAVKATREDGNRIFKEGNYELAYKVYERGVLILNGMQNLSDDKCEEMEKMESLLDLNMALCKLKLKEYTECIDLCKMSIQLDNTNPKAYYRWAEALIEMGEYQEARTQCLEAAKYAPESDKACPKLLEKIDKLHGIQIQKQKEHSKKMAAKLTKQLE